MDELLASYEAVPYEGVAIHHAHPDVLACSAILLGLEPAPLHDCRVLELGCSTGGNLLPVAMAFPQSHCVGIDLSPRHIAAGRALAEKLGVQNLSLRAADLLDLDSSLGTFDYIICHG